MRYKEHEEGVATKWTGKHHVISKVFDLPLMGKNKKQACEIEHRLTELFMERYGLDSTRGGNFVMAREGETWWVAPDMMGIPRFTRVWSNLSEHTFSALLPNDPVLARERRIFECSSALKLLSTRGQA